MICNDTMMENIYKIHIVHLKFANSTYSPNLDYTVCCDKIQAASSLVTTVRMSFSHMVC